mgnify:CR=1 FL=1
MFAVAPRTGRVDRNALLFLAVPSVFTPHFFVKCVDRNIRGELPVLDRKYCVAQKGCVDRNDYAGGTDADGNGVAHLMGCVDRN